MIVDRNHVLIFFALLVLSCATPIGPTGGLRDQTGPILLESNPVTGTTNFDGRSFEFQFDDYIDRNSVEDNLNVEPDLGLEYSIKWRRKKMIINFEDDFPDSTTIILTLGGNFADFRGNKMGAPITLAVSTGDEIDESSVVGVLRSAETGLGLEAEKVFLYREPFDLTQKAIYQAETDTGGVFRFSYLGPGTYKAVYIEDRNRNKIWERETELAQAFFEDSIKIDRADSVLLDAIYIQRPDTIPPVLQAVGMFSDRRLRLRFNENVELADSLNIQVLDSLEAPFANAEPLFIDQNEPFILFAETDRALSEEAVFSINSTGIQDASGNEAVTSGIQFQGSAQEDSTIQRIVNVPTKSGLFPDQPFQVTYSAEITEPEIFDSLVVIEGDVDFDDWPTVETRNNNFFIYPQGTWIEGLDYKFLVWNPVTQRRVIHEPEVWDQIELGGLDIIIENPDSTSSYRYTLQNNEQNLEYDSVMVSSVQIENLAPLSYQLKVFKDENGNGVWDRGSVDPYGKPEPIFIRPNLVIRTGFTSEVVIEF